MKPFAARFREAVELRIRAERDAMARPVAQRIAPAPPAKRQTTAEGIVTLATLSPWLSPRDIAARVGASIVRTRGVMQRAGVYRAPTWDRTAQRWRYGDDGVGAAVGNRSDAVDGVSEVHAGSEGASE